MIAFEDELFSKRVIDNRNVRMVDTIKHLLTESETRCFNMAVGYFYLSGLQLIKDELLYFMNEKNGLIKILMGNETNQLTSDLLSQEINSEKYLEYIPQKITKDAESIDDVHFLKLLNQWLIEKRIEVKVYTGDANYFHAKSYLFFDKLTSRSGKAIVGSSNFSKNGLSGNTELNVLSLDNFHALKDWFDTLWQSEEVNLFSPNLLNIVKSNISDYKSDQLYKPVRETYYEFSNIYGKQYTELDSSEKWVNELYPHQQLGVIDIEDKLNTFGTAVLSDGVGLGKTRTTGGIIRLENDTQKKLKTLIIADIKLKTQWSEELAIVGVGKEKFDYISREKFSLLSQNELDKISLKYSLIVIDEAHLGFKNRGTNAYRKIQYVNERALNHSLKIRGLLLTATPWNNSRKDVLNLGSLFLRVEDIPSDRSYKQYFLFGNNGHVINKLETDNQAFNEFWQDLFLQRTRKTYGGKNVEFAKRQFPTINIPYEPRKNKIFSDNFERISDLKFPYMDPIRYIIDERNQVGSDRLKMMLLKRADSSWKSYLNSLEKIEFNTNLLIKDLYQIKNIGDLSVNHLVRDLKRFLYKKYDLVNYEATNIGFFNTNIELDKVAETMANYNLNSKVKKMRYLERISTQISNIKSIVAKKALNKMISDAHADLTILNTLIDEIKKSYSKRDEKLEKVSEVVISELTMGHKVILVSQFKDTAKYYYENIAKMDIISEKKIGLVTGDNKDNRIGKVNKSKKEILDYFSPKSKKREDIVGSSEEIQLLIATDTISTGQNLQDAIVLMNLDLPYNPMVLEQRIGRIDRPRSGVQENEIFIYTFPVYDAIEAELKMTERLGKKMEGVLSDTQFDDIVLPEYVTYLEMAKKDSVKAVEKMLDDSLTKTIYRNEVSSELHTTAYKIANKRMYDMRVENFEPIKNVIFDKYSFSNGKDSHSIVVIKILFRDINGSNITTENMIVDLENFNNHEITNGEENLHREIGHSIFSTSDYNQSKATIRIKEANFILNKVKNKAVSDYNSKTGVFDGNLNLLQDKISQKAAAAIKSSVRNKANVDMIRSKLNSAGMNSKMLGTLAKNIEMIDKENELYEIVQEIAADVNQFWLHFQEYAELFDVLNLETSKGSMTKNIDIRKANAEKTTYEVLLANLII